MIPSRHAGCQTQATLGPALKKTERSPDFSALSILTSYFIFVAEARMLRVTGLPGSDFPRRGDFWHSRCGLAGHARLTHRQASECRVGCCVAPRLLLWLSVVGLSSSVVISRLKASSPTRKARSYAEECSVSLGVTGWCELDPACDRAAR